MTKKPITIDRDTAKRVIRYMERLEELATMSPMARTKAGLEGEKIHVLGNDVNRIKEQI